MTKRSIALLLAALLTVSALSGCKGGTEVLYPKKQKIETTIQNKVDTSSFRLSYSMSDSLDPFKSETLNNQVIQTLVYDSLFILDESYEAVPSVAQNYVYTSPEKLVVTIKNGFKFTDGTGLDAENIEYSFNQAKESPHWKSSLSIFSRIEIENAYEVEFYLKHPNPNAHKLLTFAIARAKPNKQGFKIGSGRYKFKESDGGVALVKNDYYPDFSPKFAKINLVNITASDSIENAINIGNISFAYLDLSEGSKTKILSSSKTVDINNLVYVGMFCKYGITANKNIRRAINLAIDRDTLVKSAYRGYANAAKSIFNPRTKLSKQTEIFSTSADTVAAKQAISASGYSKDKLTLRLVTDKSEGKKATARLIKQQLEAVGFTVNLKILGKSDYQEAVRAEYFDIYIGETKLSGDMSLRGFFDGDGGTRFGIETDGDTAKAYRGYLSGKNEVGKFILEFTEELPFLPLLYRKGMICYTKSLQGDMQGYDGNYFSNIEDWYYN